MKKIKAFGIGIGLLVAIPAALFIVVANFAAVERRYECAGTITQQGEATSVSIFLKLEEYRWWVFWSDSSGALWIEIPNTTVEFYSHIETSGDLRRIYEDHLRKSQGVFSYLSNTIGIQTSRGLFEGKCKALN